MVPALSTLLANTAGKVLGYFCPVFGSISEHNLAQKVVFCFWPGCADHVASIAQLKEAFVALNFRLADQLADSTPRTLTISFHKFQKLLILRKWSKMNTPIVFTLNDFDSTYLVLLEAKVLLLDILLYRLPHLFGVRHPQQVFDARFTKGRIAFFILVCWGRIVRIWTDYRLWSFTLRLIWSLSIFFRSCSLADIDDIENVDRALTDFDLVWRLLMFVSVSLL